MQTVLIVIHLMVVLALVGVVLLQRSEGGGLGIGGGSGFMTARGASNALTRATAILATVFFITSLALSIHARYYSDNPTDILDRLPPTNGQPQAPTGQGGVLDQLGGQGATPPSATAPANGATAPSTATPPAVTTPVAPAAPTGVAPASPSINEPVITPSAPATPATPSAPQAPTGG